MWELLTGQIPYSDLQIFAIPNAVMTGKRPTVPSQVNQIHFK